MNDLKKEKNDLKMEKNDLKKEKNDWRKKMMEHFPYWMMSVMLIQMVMIQMKIDVVHI